MFFSQRNSITLLTSIASPSLKHWKLWICKNCPFQKLTRCLFNWKLHSQYTVCGDRLSVKTIRLFWLHLLPLRPFAGIYRSRIKQPIRAGRESDGVSCSRSGQLPSPAHAWTWSRRNGGLVNFCLLHQFWTRWFGLFGSLSRPYQTTQYQLTNGLM